MFDLVAGLENWYASNCDGDWERQLGVQIGTLGNPGWSVEIDIEDTTLSGKMFEPVKVEREEHDWIHCKVEDDVFKGYGGPKNLGEILKIFLSWSGADSADGP